jgi:hypothetical protein
MPKKSVKKSRSRRNRDKILNPKTGRYVLKSGRIGKKLLEKNKSIRKSKSRRRIRVKKRGEIKELPKRLRNTKKLEALLADGQWKAYQQRKQISDDFKLVEKYKKIDPALFKLQVQIFCKKYSSKVYKAHKKMIKRFCGVHYFDVEEEMRKLREFKKQLKIV